MAGNLFNRTSGTFANTKRNNNCDTLDDELDEIKAAFDVLETGKIELGIGESIAGGTYTEAALQLSSSATKGQINGSRGRVFIGIKAASNIDFAEWQFRIPHDAKASTAATFKIHCVAGTTGDGNDIKVYFLCERDADTDAQDPSSHAPTTTDDVTFTRAGDYADSKQFTLSFSTTACSANDSMHVLVYRDADDAADTCVGSFIMMNATLEYTRTA